MMNKEDVLIVEFKPIFHKWGMKIIYQNYNVLNRGVFKDEVLRVHSFNYPDYDNKNDTLFVRGLNEDKDENIILLSEQDKLKIEEKIKLLNEKYYTFILSRESNGNKYYFISSQFEVSKSNEIYHEVDDERHNVGNYFFTEEEATECLKYLKKCLINWHRERCED